MTAPTRGATRAAADTRAALAVTTVAAVAALAGCTVPAPDTLQPQPDPVVVVAPAGLTVAPQTTLFAVTLRPGEEHLAEATLTNDAAAPQTVAMSTVVDELTGAEHGALDLQVSARFGACADTSDGAAPAALGSGAVVPVGTVGPAQTVPLCGRIALPTDTALPAGTAVTFTIVLASVEQPAPSGADTPWRTDWPDRAELVRHALPVAAALAAGTGIAALLLIRRRRVDGPDDTGVPDVEDATDPRDPQPTSEDLR